MKFKEEFEFAVVAMCLAAFLFVVLPTIVVGIVTGGTFQPPY